MSLLKNILRWARITKAGINGQQFYTQKMQYMGKIGEGVIVYPFGFHANASAGSMALMMSIQGNEENRAAFAFDPKNRPDLEEGEVAFYHPATGKYLIFRKTGKLEGNVTSAELTVDNTLTATVGGNVTLTTPTLTLNGNLVVNGTMTNNGKNVGDTHGHTQSKDSGDDTQQPIVGVS